jgi:hypothetical protein
VLTTYPDEASVNRTQTWVVFSYVYIGLMVITTDNPHSQNITHHKGILNMYESKDPDLDETLKFLKKDARRKEMSLDPRIERVVQLREGVQ